jgi:hypothetical protein
MKLYDEGTTRIVIAVPLLGVAIKIARINPLKGLQRLFIFPLKYTIKKGNFKKFWNYLYRETTECNSRSINSSRYYLFRGINANWQEFWFYLKNRHPLLQPTYFSFFGLFNIQRIAYKPLITKSECGCQFIILAPRTLTHGFESAANFCLDKNDKLKFLDYGDEKIRKVIISDGDKIYQQFDPDWDYEEYKKSHPD